MTELGESVSAVLITGAFLAALSGCQKEGPAEKAGREVDKAVEKVAQQIAKAGDAIQDAAKDDKK
jgi:hypothetical protein